MLNQKSKIKNQKFLYGDITNRLFAFAFDLAILYMPLNLLTQLALKIFFPLGNQFEMTRAKVLSRFPEVASDAPKLYQLMAENYPAELSIIFRQMIFITCFQLFLIGIYVVPMVYKYGATLGKKIVGIKVVDYITEGRITLSQSVIRYLAYFASIAPLCIGLFTGGLRRNKRCWHDFLADTVVVYAPDRWYRKYMVWVVLRVRRFFNLKDK